MQDQWRKLATQRRIKRAGRALLPPFQRDGGYVTRGPAGDPGSRKSGRQGTMPGRVALVPGLPT